LASNYRVAGRVTLNLMCDREQALGEAGQVESLPCGTLVILRVTGSPDPAVVDRLRTFGAHVQFEIHGRDGASTRAWVRALRYGVLWAL
jgi:hypothetical protein